MSGPGSDCLCGCGEPIPAGRRPHCEFVNDTHRKRYRRGAKTVEDNRPSQEPRKRGRYSAGRWRAEMREQRREIALARSEIDAARNERAQRPGLAPGELHDELEASYAKAQADRFSRIASAKSQIAALIEHAADRLCLELGSLPPPIIDWLGAALEPAARLTRQEIEILSVAPHEARLGAREGRAAKSNRRPQGKSAAPREYGDLATAERRRGLAKQALDEAGAPSRPIAKVLQIRLATPGVANSTPGGRTTGRDGRRPQSERVAA